MPVAFRALAPAVALLLLSAPLAARAAEPGEPLRACARIGGLDRPLEVAGRLRHLPAAERRARLVEALKASIATRSRAARALLVRHGATRVNLLFGAGVVCADAPEEAWAAVERLPLVEAVFLDPELPDAEIDDSGGPNTGVPPESPLVSLRVPEMWAAGYTGKGVVVAHVDTGVDVDHPDLADHLWVNEDEIPGNGVDDDGNGFVDDVNGWNFSTSSASVDDNAGHGTSTSGLLAGDGTSGSQTGVAPDVSIMVVRRGGTQEALWLCSDYAIANGAQVMTQSVSWKWSFNPEPDYPSWRRQAETELAAGLIHVNSAGNSGDDLLTDPVPYNIAAPANSPPPWLHPSLPQQAGLSSVIAVGNVDARSLIVDPDSPYGPAEWTDIQANVDPTYPHAMPLDLQDYPEFDGSGGLGKPDLVAPGQNSLTTAKDGGYVSFGGTSAAQPRVAGILALLLQAVPDATPAELTEALMTTARDLGPAGFDNRHGAGLPDAAAALSALGPPVVVDGFAVLDDGAPHGDGDGDADEGEIVRLSLTVRNTSGAAIEDVDLILSGVQGATERDGYARIASVPAGGTAATAAPHFSFEIDPATCGAYTELALEIRAAGSKRVVPLFPRVGTEVRTPLIDADFESAAGFSVSGSPGDGAWVRAVPVGTSSGGTPVAPSADHTPDPASTAWVTGNGSTDPDGDDVDGGASVLTSTAHAAAAFDEVELVYHRWFSGSDPAAGDRLLVESTGDGASWTVVEEVTGADPLWRERRIVLSDLMTPGASTRIRVTTEDLGADHTVEGGLDDVGLTGVDIACSTFTVTPNAPDPLGATLMLAPLPGGHLELSWDPPSATGGTDPVAGYDVTRSLGPAGGFASIGSPIDPRFVVVDGMADDGAAIRYYLVSSN